MTRKIISLVIVLMGLYFIYDNNFFGSQQFVRDIRKDVYLPEENKYTKTNVNNSFAKMTTDFTPSNKQEILDIYFTMVNSGWNKFIFYCDYDDCMDDVNTISTDMVLLSNINNFVSTYNQYSTIHTFVTPALNSKVELTITKTYSKVKTALIDNEIDKIILKLKLDKYSNKDKIRIIHDFIIKNTKYDSLKAKNINDQTYDSSTAYGLLFEGYAVCSGYADTMSIFLDKLNIPNIKVASTTHVWNLVQLDNKWYHLDLTWDDPYSIKGTDSVNHNFFLITYTQLKQWNTKEHIFDHEIYKEAL